ncbi:MAG: hypothetical protein IJ058_01860 [Lachnospiraceae bacterium]|nr:hypothetical protein [Lachnospiraceae bacterium]
MRTLNQRLESVEKHIKEDNIVIMIIGLGSVGTYLLDYLVSRNDPAIRIVVVGRNYAKMEQNVNIVRIAALIRELNKSQIEICDGVDLNDTDAICDAINRYKPDFIVNSSRAYPGLKYGSISWANVRAYGIWTPLAIRFTRNIMEACDQADTDALVINTSYSDAVIPWLKSAGKAYPDLGSGNLNHLVPRIRYAVASMIGTEDFWNVEVMFAAGHFHDVCISKEGHTEGVKLPLKVYYKGVLQDLDQDEIFKRCSISMPTDQQRNMMNASSNYRIIDAVISVIRESYEGNPSDDPINAGSDAGPAGQEKTLTKRIFSPGAFGNIGGYPVCIGYRNGRPDAWIDESAFSLEEMNAANRASMALDGVEDVADGNLIYTDDLIGKAKKAFGVELPKTVSYDEIDKTAQFLIEKIIIPQTS